VGTRWQRSDAPRGDDYDARWSSLAAQGRNVHGEADLIDTLLRESGGTRVLDAGCGTGRVAIELAQRGYSVTGADADAAMLTAAMAKAPALTWLEADLADLDMAADAAVSAAYGSAGERCMAVSLVVAVAGAGAVASWEASPERHAFSPLSPSQGVDLLT